ncbi:hypothetical protein C2E23DRAFT_279542 [Lenzites betulinus]|nr:hypothetical protein C2E23DRAFT_279542 [Lenzites betulinus]
MKLSAILSLSALTLFSATGVAAYSTLFEEALDDLSQGIALSTDIQSEMTGLNAADFITKAPLIVDALQDIAGLATKFTKQARYGTVFSDEQAKDVLESVSLFINDQQPLLQALVKERSLVREFVYTSQFAKALSALQDSFFDAEEALVVLIPTRTKEANALFRVINDAVESALEAYH